MPIDSLAELIGTAIGEGATAAATTNDKSARKWLWGIAAAGILGLGAYAFYEFNKEKPAVKAPTEQRLSNSAPQPK